MKKKLQYKNLILAYSGIAILAVAGFNLYKYLRDEMLGFSDWIAIPLLLIFFFNTLTWNSEEEQKDERGQLITYKSAKIGYFALLILIFIVFVIVEFPMKNQPIQNYPLFIVLCAAIVILPVCEWIVSRRHR
ncbi:hypothetical protein [Paenibacillus sp. J2TS4]|uniref:hypothetical protein n=1 Tax=Paenibacillus sp. J2TS4 TaxID=2807194 RepID=UPI001B125EF1|nr:hypothetical protein [Paenibacillus sp. J2TS4]GIP31527.1 hypothetical protein J2TS4_07370 [Paenibacillus sp. J2TS4]